MKSTRRVSFDPLALLWDASLEGELDLVKQVATQVNKISTKVPNPSAANDEGVTALHNAATRGHFDMVKFLVEIGCDVNIQNTDGWAPLHCAAGHNHLAMVKYLIENGACPFALTHFSHETPLEKCCNDSTGYEACYAYLLDIQEKIGTINKSEVYGAVSFDGKKPDDLSFEVNDQLIILRKGDGDQERWWARMKETGDEGYVPRNLLALRPSRPMRKLSD